jgi:NAD(P)-dependent dehydrogenase (short-subunit alcohol dehydrogenase family)
MLFHFCARQNAGFGGSASIFEDRDVFDAILDVNLHGVINVTRAFRDALCASDKGALVNTSSISSFHVNAGVAYSTSKFAVRGLTEGLIGDFAKHAPHITVHCVMPGYIATDIGLYSTIANYKIQHGGKPPRQELIERWTEATKAFSENPLGLPQQDAAEIIVHGVEVGTHDRWLPVVALCRSPLSHRAAHSAQPTRCFPPCLVSVS